MDHGRLLDGLIENERLMARLYREMAARLPAKHELLEGLSREEEKHASMLLGFRDTFFPTGMLDENDISITVQQLEQQANTIEKVITDLEDRSFDEQEIVAMLLDLELASAELQINRIIVEHKDEPGLKVFVEILDNEQAHNRVLEEWRSTMS